jgi:CHASE2 domain-containing sensor protein
MSKFLVKYFIGYILIAIFLVNFTVTNGWWIPVIFIAGFTIGFSFDITRWLGRVIRESRLNKWYKI